LEEQFTIGLKKKKSIVMFGANGRKEVKSISRKPPAAEVTIVQDLYSVIYHNMCMFLVGVGSAERTEHQHYVSEVWEKVFGVNC
jgi:hypothetical protein